MVILILTLLLVLILVFDSVSKFDSCIGTRIVTLTDTDAATSTDTGR
jgi:hypothetical protein